MRFTIAAVVAAGLVAAPAIAQDTNQTNTAAPTETAEPAPGNAVVDPLPAADEPAAVATPLEPAEPTDGTVTGRRERGFPWGLIGLIGLIGLLGRRRSS